MGKGDPKFGVDDLLLLRGADREAKAYAFLYAAFKRTEISSNPVRDALDCLVPFVAPYTNDIAGKQVTAEGVREYLRERVGFNIPLYAVEQVFSSLQQHGYIEFVKHSRVHIAKAHESRFEVAMKDIESDYDGMVEELSKYAIQVGMDVAPPSGDWGEALVGFLRRNTERPAAKFTPVKTVLMDPQKVEDAIVAGFVRKLSEQSPEKFQSLTNVFMGALIEDFISSVTEVGAVAKGRPVDIFYDTSVILRQLGCSGTLLRVATEELTQYLHDIGCNIYYFSGNEGEVSNIIDTVLYVKDTGKEVEGETAEALALGQVTTTDLRMLQNTIPEKLAHDNIFPAGELEALTLTNTRWQIDEKGFSEYLFRAAVASGRAYGIQNRTNDASYLAGVMRIRKGLRARDFAECGAVFVTSNRLLAFAARKYLVEQKLLAWKECPPVLHLGQIATIAWLMKDHAITPEKAGRELLLHCYAAVNPDADWFKYFREGMEKVVGPVDEYAKDGSNAITLQAARRIAGEESFGHSLVVRELNMAEILARAKDEVDAQRVQWASAQAEEKRLAAEQLAELDSSHQKKREEIVREAEVDRRRAVEEARQSTEASVRHELADAKARRSMQRAERAMSVVKGTTLALFVVATLAALIWGNAVWWVVSVFLALTTVASFGDMLRMPFVSKFLDSVKDWFFRFFQAL